MDTAFEVNIAKETFKFNAGHFVAFRGFRERLHGHNYKVSVRLLGSRMIGSDGYVLDFGDVKAVTKKVCKSMNEYFLCPMYSDVLKIDVAESEDGKGGTITITCEDGSVFVFPKGDCLQLPIVHSTVEELSVYLWGKLLQELGAPMLTKRGIHTMEITVSEALGQEAVFRNRVPDDDSDIAALSDVRKYIDPNIKPTPCQH